MMTLKKTSDTSIRVLETLKIFLDRSASVQDVISYFEQADPNNRIYTNEVILKYINTLKVFGFRFIKEKDKYVLLNTPNQFDFNENDLRSICLIEKFSELLFEERLNFEITKFLQRLERHFSDNTRLRAADITKPNFVSLGPDYKKYSKQITEYEKYCFDKQKIKIFYKTAGVGTVSTMVEPNEIKYTGKSVYLNVYNPISAQIQDINFNSILKIEQLPVKSNSTSMLSSATFLLKDRLAKVYKLHDGEKVFQIKKDGSIVVLNQKEDRTLLLKRLMRYGWNCEVLSPKALREEMKQLIENTSKNYH